MILITSKRYRYDFTFSVLLVGMTVASNAALIPSLGMNGAAIATMSTVIVYNLIRIGFVWKFFRIQPFAATDCWIVLLTGAMVGLSALIPYLGNFILDAAVRTLVISLLFGATVYYTNASPQLNATPRRPARPYRHPPAPVVPRPPDAPRTGGNHAFTKPRDYRHQPDPIRHASRSSYMRLIAPVSSSAPCPILASSVPRDRVLQQVTGSEASDPQMALPFQKGKSSKGKDPDKKALRKCGRAFLVSIPALTSPRTAACSAAAHWPPATPRT